MIRYEDVKKALDEDLVEISDMNKLNDLKVKYLGKKGIITELNSEIRNVPNEEKKEFGMKVNELRNRFNEFFDSTKEKIEQEELNKRLENSFSKVGIVKYDAFKQMGGLLSFSLALLNEKDSGFVINSVHSTEGCYTYIKEITAGICEMDLSSEEKEALSRAIKNK